MAQEHPARSENTYSGESIDALVTLSSRHAAMVGQVSPMAANRLKRPMRTKRTNSPNRPHDSDFVSERASP